MKKIALFIVFYCIYANVYARIVEVPVTLSDGTQARWQCSDNSCSVNWIEYPRTGTSFTDYTLWPSPSSPPSEKTSVSSAAVTPPEAVVPLLPIITNVGPVTPVVVDSNANGVSSANPAIQYNSPTRVETENGTTTAYYKNTDWTYSTAAATVETENGVTTTYIKQPNGTYTTIAGDATQTTTSATNSTNSHTSTNTNLINTNNKKDNILWIEEWKLRKGEVSMDDIPDIIVSVISTLLGIAGSIAIASLIYHAVQMQINSGITGDSSWVDKAKKGMTGALIGFVIAISAWFLVTHAVALLGSI